MPASWQARNIFAKHMNVDTKSRLTQNRAKGRKTFIFIDEIYLLFQHEYSANFLFITFKKKLVFYQVSKWK